MHTGPQEPMNRFSERRRSPLWVKSTHYRAAALLSASPQSTDISASGDCILSPCHESSIAEPTLVMLALLSGLNNVRCEDRACGLSVSSRIEFGSAGLKGFPRFVQWSDQSANFVRSKRPDVFLEISVHYNAPSTAFRAPAPLGTPGDPAFNRNIAGLLRVDGMRVAQTCRQIRFPVGVSEAAKPIVAFVFPISARVMVGNGDGCDVLRVLKAELRGYAQSQWGAPGRLQGLLLEIQR
jgi:hypothetical protein